MSRMAIHTSISSAEKTIDAIYIKDANGHLVVQAQRPRQPQ